MDRNALSYPAAYIAIVKPFLQNALAAKKSVMHYWKKDKTKLGLNPTNLKNTGIAWQGAKSEKQE